MTVEVTSLLSSAACETGSHVDTFVLRYPRNIHGEFMTHRKFGRNASSSRAIPMKKMHRSIENDPALPEKWTLDEPGMQGYQEADEATIRQARAIIETHRDYSIEVAEKLAALGLHKQIFNRYTEAHQHIRVVVTSSDWHNFIQLRTHETAEPTIQELARQIQEAARTAKTKKLGRGEWHLPYFNEEEFADTFDTGILEDMQDALPPQLWHIFPPYSGKRALTKLAMIAVSAARCARVSYNNFKGRRSSIQEDIELFMKLIVAQPIHASPLEHQATPDWFKPGAYQSQSRPDLSPWTNPHQHGNLIGWRQARKFIPGEDGVSHEWTS